MVAEGMKVGGVFLMVFETINSYWEERYAMSEDTVIQLENPSAPNRAASLSITIATNTERRETKSCTETLSCDFLGMIKNVHPWKILE